MVLSKQNIWKIKKIKIKTIQILDILNSLKFWNSLLKNNVKVLLFMRFLIIAHWEAPIRRLQGMLLGQGFRVRDEEIDKCEVNNVFKIKWEAIMN